MTSGDNSTLYILYGSATGNAEGISKDLTADLNDNKATRLPAPFKKAVCMELNQFKKCLKVWEVAPSTAGQKHGAILVSSTTGNGDPPENAGRFTRFIKKQNKDASKPKPFEHLAFAVLGLGDTNYDQFCETGKVIDRMVDSLGGTRAKPLVCADEGTGLLEETVDPWMGIVAQDVARACLGSSSAACGAEEEKVEKADPAADPAASEITTPAPETSPTPLYVLYGSATGNAEVIAKDLTATYEMILSNPDSKTFFPSVVCAELNQFKKLKLAEQIWSQPPVPGNKTVKHGVLVVASTTGNGDAPENSDKFLRFLKKSARALSKDPSGAARPFEHVAFGVLGLGDTNYDQFCQHAKLLHKYMGELGGTPVRPLTCADEGTGQLEDVVDRWTADILMEVTAACRGRSASEAAAPPSKAKAKAKAKAVATVVPKKRTSEPAEEEEKKVDPFDDVVSEEPSSPSTSPGVLLVQSLLSSGGEDAMSLAASLPKSSLKSHVTSVEFVSDDAVTDQATTISDDDDDASDDGAKYTLGRPYESTVAGARYLTATSSDAANEICEMMDKSSGGTVTGAQEILDRRFPLHVENDVAEASRNGKRVIELALTLPDDESWEYQPGDSLGLIVHNTPDAVDFVLNMLQSNHGIGAAQKVSIDAGVPRTVREVVRETIDLCTVVKSRKILHALSEVCTDPRERAVLELLASKTERGSELFEAVVHAQRRSVVDLLRDFPSCQSITLQGLVSLLPPIPPRYYSVSSSPLEGEKNGSSSSSNNTLTVAFSIVDYLTPSLAGNDGTELGRRRIHGLATSHIESLCAPFLSSENSTKQAAAASCLKIFPKPTEEFHLPEDLTTPLVLIGPGTGIAPFMGFLSHRKALAKSGTGSVEVFFGCRHSNHDYLYRDELETFDKDGVIDHLHVAFSRDGAKKEYVQDIMLNNAECGTRLAETLLNGGGRVYVCGDGNHMGRDVQAAFAKLLGPRLVSSGGESAETAGITYIEMMKSEGRFLLDIWS
eukprot:CAMPEP_0172368906 /NCGR_PEP_ID=MMETSP1060-20121228/29634_1 /TAXON_ID=37318 /ORGANISM="Pseudo-nitzschia pungens, Strain cf. cingulata" /LENGTH=1003 /DNA_ID=CAMNT_0013093647 /DNA_START=232 /DNA_END=3243 /DNA_ORIENTATION=+